MNANEESNVEQHLLSRDGAEDAQPLEAGAVRKLQCLICMLAMIVVGLVASLNEARVHHRTHMTKLHQNGSQHPWYLVGTPTAWISWCIKCAQLSMAIGAFAYLERRVLRPGKIPIASFHNAASPERPVTVLKNVHYYLELPKSLANYPSKLFVSMFLIFALLSGVCGLGETAGFIMDAADPKIYELIPYFEVLRCLLLTTFICAQTAFFIRHNRACIQWKLDGVWLAVCLIIATNISAWFFYVGYELCESMEDEGGNATESAATSRKAMQSVGQIFSPFLIEFFIMGAILAAGFLTNAGLLARILQQKQICGIITLLTPDSIRELLRSKPRPHRGFWRQQRRSLLFGLGLVSAALTASVALKLLLPHSLEYSMKISLSCAQSALYLSGIVCAAVLLRQLSDKTDGEKHQTESKGHGADRLLLLLGALAVLVNDSYRLWFCLSGNCTDWSSGLLTAAITLPNICQSILQVYLLECILVRRFLPRTSVQVDGRRGGKLLTALLLLNAAEWLVSAVAFSILFDSSHQETINLVLAVCTMPLQVFFRFHSIACIHEFKKHCSEAREVAPEQPVRATLTVDFPSLTRPAYGSVL